MSRSSSTSGHDQSSPPGASPAPLAPAATPAREAPSLRLRYHAPSEPEQAAIENVLAEAGELSHGINAMLHRAAKSTVGAEDDEPMMAMFDEDEPADIREMDRQLAGEAEAAIASAIVPSEHAGDHASDEPEMSLEGEFESVEGLLVGMTAASPAATVSANSSAFDTPIAMTQASGLARASSAPAAIAVVEPSTFQPSQAAAAIAAEPPFPTVDLSLAPTQAAGIAAALAAASASASLNSPAVSATPMQPSPPAPVPPASVAIQAAPAPIETRAAAPQAAATPVSAASSPEAPRRASGPSSIARSIAQMIAITNLPLRYVPASMRPAINMLALSLALWAPAVWAIAPMMAARQAANALPDVDMPVHAESSLEAGKDHGEAKAEESHGKSEADHGAKASKAGRKSSRPSSTNKSGDTKSAASHH